MKSHECAATRVCSKCGKRKSQDKFYASSQSRKCKACLLVQSKDLYRRKREIRLAQCAEYRAANKDSVKRYLAGWYQRRRDHVLARCAEYNQRPEVKERDRIRHAERYLANRDAIQESRKAYYEANPDAKLRVKAYQLRHYQNNKPMYVARGGLRRRLIKRATPPWANKEAILAFYVEAERKTAETGILHVVDHIVPLQGKRVSGLHVENNLQVITADANLRKANKFEC